MPNIAETSELEDKIIANRELLMKIHTEFGDNILFTGGTSLMERKIINRFSEDIDLIVTVSRKKIISFLKKDMMYEIISTLPGSRVSSYEINVHHRGTVITTKIDLVSLYTRYPNISIDELHKNSFVTLDSYKNPIKCKCIKQILHDKICAIVEDYEVIKQYVDSSKNKGYKKKTTERKKFIREMRHYYDIASIMHSGYNIDKVALSNEFGFRISNSKIKLGLDNIDSLYIFINTPNYFNEIYDLFKEQLFQEVEHVTYENIKVSINEALNMMVEIAREQ